ncbi:MAG TPA: ABC transporter substrate-binding protein [Candidatus Dormibacteraeota bacterium]|jgi:osmoprotectant transport system substrate-binding protein|nr:ABC transporter substrate-binding protein [Candidatus Dormibacteraeota bacterium]
MNMKFGSGRFLAALAGLVFVATACGSTSNGGTSSPASKGTLTVAGFNFPESSILAEIYGQSLAHDGYTINYKLLLGTREVVAPALESGQIDLYPGYAATDLEFYNKGAGEATGDPVATTAKLNSRLQPLGLTALTASPAVDQNAFAVTKATQTKYSLTSLSDLAAIGSQLTLGAGPECPTRPFCLPGLKKTYNITFKAFKPLDTDGPLTRAAFKNGSIDVGLVFSSDGDLNSLGLVVLKDDKQLENADNVVPILRQAAASAEVSRVLNAIDAKLTTADLVTMNSQVSILHQDADAVATAWLQQHNYYN